MGSPEWRAHLCAHLATKKRKYWSVWKHLLGLTAKRQGAAKCGQVRQGAAMCGKVYTFNCPPGEEPEIGGAKRAGLGEERLVPWRQHTLDHSFSCFFVIDDRAAITNASTDCGN